MSERLPIIEAMAGEPRVLPPVELPETRTLVRAGVILGVAGVAASAALTMPGGLGKPEQASAENGLEYWEAELSCVSANQAQAKVSLHNYTPADLARYKFGVASSANLDQNNEAPELPEGQRIPLADLLSSTRPATDGVTTPPYNNDALYNGSTTIIRQVPSGTNFVTLYAYQDDPTTPFIDRYSTASKPLDCKTEFPVNGGGTGGTDGQTPPPAPAPVCKFDATITAQTKGLLPKNGKGVLSVGVSLSPDSTGNISGAGKGDSLKAKERNRAAHLEVKFAKPAKITGKLPKGMIALHNGKTLKKGQTPNMVSIDIPSRGVSPDHGFNAKLKYQLVKKAGSFVVSLKGLGGNVNFTTPGCGTVNVASAKALSKAR